MSRKDRAREKLADLVDVSKDIITDTVLIKSIGTREMIVENYKAILEYSERKIKIKALPKIVHISGEKLDIENISEDTLCIKGSFDKIVFSND